MMGDQPNIMTTGVFDRKELERYARGKLPKMGNGLSLIYVVEIKEISTN